MKEPHTHKNFSFQGTVSLLVSIWRSLSRRRKLQLGLLLLVMLASGVAELFSLATVLPFLMLLSDPAYLWKQPVVQALAGGMGFTDAHELVLPATIIFGVITLLTASVRLANRWLNGRLAAAIGSDLSCEAYRRTLYQPYEVHLQRNSANIISSATTHISQTIAAINAVLQIITASVVAIGLVTGLMIVDALVASTVAGVFGGAYFALAFINRRELQGNSKKISTASFQQVKALQEGIGAIRDVLLDGSQKTYFRIYQKADIPLRRLQARNIFLGAFPKYALEALAMVTIAALGGLLVLQRGSSTTLVALMGTLALGAQRLLPALQQIYTGWTVVKSRHASLVEVLFMVNQSLPLVVSTKGKLPVLNSIYLCDVRFKYAGQSEDVLKGIHLQINRGERIGFIGVTGSGKSTLIDLIMGLLPPRSGQVFIDGVDLYDPQNTDKLNAWRSSIAHVPQDIYLTDGSIAENIAFGLPKNQIDISLMQQAANQAQISEFINSLPDSFNSFVGERGVRLSGGQRQRIGIARALYKNAKILILDEATSALDVLTESKIMSSIKSLSKDLTILMIAHRLSTLKNCDRVVKLEHGLTTYDGPPRDLLKGPH